MSNPFGIFEGFFEQAYEGDREQDNLVEVGFGDAETDNEDSDGFRSGSSSSSEGEQPVKRKTSVSIPQFQSLLEFQMG
ncbi:hypothetical protein TB2_006112 [Malus domestica]